MVPHANQRVRRGSVSLGVSASSALPSVQGDRQYWTPGLWLGGLVSGYGLCWLHLWPWTNHAWSSSLRVLICRWAGWTLWVFGPHWASVDQDWFSSPICDYTVAGASEGYLHADSQASLEALNQHAVQSLLKCRLMLSKAPASRERRGLPFVSFKNRLTNRQHLEPLSFEVSD